MNNSNYNRGRPDKFSKDEHRINYRIRVPQVRVVIEATGEQLGIISTEEAMKQANMLGLDLVEVSPTANPPVCKIMDYGKFKYKEQKKKTDAKKKRVEVETKELRIRYKTDIGDFNTKIEKAKDFLSKGHKVKFSMQFRGREIAFLDLGIEKLKEVTTALEGFATIDSQSNKPGRLIFITFAPAKSK